MSSTLFEPASLDDFLLNIYPGEYVSASSLKMFVRCPEQWRRRYLLGHKAPPSAALVWGGADHKAVGANYEQKIASEKDLPVGEVQEMFVHELEKGLDDNGGAQEILWDGKDFADKTPEQGTALVKDRGVKLVAAYQEQIAPALFPETVEQEFLLPVDGLPIPVKGYIDLTAKRPVLPMFGGETMAPDDGPFVVERKTKAQNRAPGPEDRFQARLYELATGLPVEFQVSVKTAAPRVVVHEPLPLEPASRTVQALKRAVLGIASCYALYGPEQPWPDNGRVNTSFGGPSCDFCSYKSSCGWWHEEHWPR